MASQVLNGLEVADLNPVENVWVDLKRGVNVLTSKIKTSTLVSYFCNKMQFLKKLLIFYVTSYVTVLRKLETKQNRSAMRT